MELLHNQASILLNSICFRPLKTARYNFDFKHPERKVVYVPIKVKTPAPAPAPPSSSSSNNDKKNQPAGDDDDDTSSYYYVPCLLIQGKNLSSAFSSSPDTANGSSSNSYSNNKKELPISKNVIIHFHGTSGDIVKSHVWATMSKNLPDYDIICVEFPGGYGTASGRFPSSSSSSSSSFQPFLCTRESLMEVARGVTDFLISKAHIKEENIIFSGRSMGTGVAVELAARYFTRCRAMILLSPYSSMSAVIRGVVESKVKTNIFFLRSIASSLIGSLLNFLCSFGRTSLFESNQYIENVDCPTWIAHGKKDTLIPIAHAEQLVSRIQLSDCTSPSRRRQQPKESSQDANAVAPSTSSSFAEQNNTKSSNISGSFSSQQQVQVKGDTTNRTNSKYVHLFVDPEGTHPEVDFDAPLAKFLNDLAASQSKKSEEEKQTLENKNNSMMLWSQVPFASPQIIAQLKEIFKKDTEQVRSYKSRCRRALIVAIVLAAACSVAVSTVSWKYLIRPKLLKN